MKWNERRKNVIIDFDSKPEVRPEVFKPNNGKRKRKSIWIAIFTDLFYIKKQMLTIFKRTIANNFYI